MVTFIFRYLTPLLALSGALALVVSAWLMVNAYAERERLAVELAAQEAAYTAEQEEIARVEAYEEFADRVREFTESARAAGLVPDDWQEYEVAFEQREVELDELHQLVEDARHGPGHYFRPESVLITSSPEAIEADDLEDEDADGLLTLTGRYWGRDE